MFRDGKLFRIFFILVILFLFSIQNLSQAQNPQLFTEMTSIQIAGVYQSSAEWGDFDNDGDLDILFCGQAGAPITKIYKNNGDNTFTEMTSINLFGVESGSLEWGDYDNDGDLDILLTGDRGTQSSTKIYQNNGDDTFTEMSSILLAQVSHGCGAWGDYDNDGDLDILITGANNLSLYSTKIYRNDKNNVFTEISYIQLTDVSGSAAVWGDYDNDGDLDIVLTGKKFILEAAEVSMVYRNDGNDSFNEQDSIDLYDLWLSSVNFGDYDNDGDLDLLLTGDRGFTNEFSKVYRNNSDNTFTEMTSIILNGVDWGMAIWGDYDNDGDLDIFLTGRSSHGISKFYKNNNNSFNEDYSLSFITPVRMSSAAWGDYDKDGDLDLLLTGWDDSNNGITKIYRNNSVGQNSIPSSPSNLIANVSGSEVSLSWDKSTDAETPQDGLSYNLAVGSQPGGTDVQSPMSDMSSGFRKIVKLGNTNLNNSWTIKNLSPGTYYWSVQAIDHNYAGSVFAEEKSFIITDPVPVELISFSVSLLGNSVQLKWNTATELNNLGFEIERQNSEFSSQNSEWEKIGFVEGEGNSAKINVYSFLDDRPISGNVNYRLKQIDFDGSFEYSEIVEINLTPQEFELSQNHPNPFNPTTKINYAIPERENSEVLNVKLVIYDILGNEVTKLVDEQKSPGNYSVEFDASGLTSGMYIYRIQAGGYVDTKKMILLK